MALAFAKTLLDLLFPPLCIGCRAPVADSGFCAGCWSRLSFLDGPACACCGLPFPVALEGENLCAACLVRPPAFDRARAILAYDEHSRAAILALKHADRLELVPGFARWLARSGRSLIAESDVIMPVPLHRSRLWQRRYNQSAEMARRLARDWNLAFDPFALVRSRATLSQGAMASPKARRRNVLSAFKVPDTSRVAGKRVLLLDDVLTTGATVEACARALKRAGAARVHVLALARVVKASDMLI
ncbi:MAG TPA: ComF family protein [Rhizomicrobium sp.]|jgi:ComF family protein